MENSKKQKKSYSIWDATLEDINKPDSSSPIEKEIKDFLDKNKNKDIDITKPIPEIEDLKKIFF